MGYVCGEGEELARKAETGEMESSLLGNSETLVQLEK